MREFWKEVDAALSKYDLLRHPFYQAWAEGKLTRNDLGEYARQYFHHVSAFPEYLQAFSARLNGEMRSAVESNRRDELGEGSVDGKTHADLWAEFVVAMDATCDGEPIPEVAALLATFDQIAKEGSPVEALAAFYAYEAQVPRIAAEKARGLRAWYGADDRACRYFDLHTTADVHHANVWRQAMERELQRGASPEAALRSVEIAARALWTALDGIERERAARTSRLRPVSCAT